MKHVKLFEAFVNEANKSHLPGYAELYKDLDDAERKREKDIQNFVRDIESGIKKTERESGTKAKLLPDNGLAVIMAVVTGIRPVGISSSFKSTITLTGLKKAYEKFNLDYDPNFGKFDLTSPGNMISFNARKHDSKVHKNPVVYLMQLRKLTNLDENTLEEVLKYAVKMSK